jgi:hypothetical protein
MPRLTSILRWPLAALILVALGSVAWAKPKVAVLGLEVSYSGTVDPKDAANASKMTEELRRIVQGGGTRYELSALGNRELQDEKLMGNCDTERPACMAPIAAAMQADVLIYGRVTKQRDSYRVAMKMLNVKKREVEETWDGTVLMSAIGTPALKVWAQLVHTKLGSMEPAAPAPAPRPPAEKPPGRLALVVRNAAAGAVFIEGIKRGELAEGTVTLTLPEGTHRLAIEAPQRRRYEELVTVQSGQQKPVSIELEEVLETPPVGTGEGRGAGSRAWGIMMWGGMAAAVGGGGVWVYGWRQIGDAHRGLCGERSSCAGKSLKDGPKEDEGLKTKLEKQGEDGQTLTRVGAAVVAAGVVVAGVGALKRYVWVSSPRREEARASGAGRRARRELAVTPVVSAGGAGAVVRFAW